MKMFDRIREWYENNQDTVMRRGAMAMGMIMAIVGLCYAVGIAVDLGWL